MNLYLVKVKDMNVLESHYDVFDSMIVAAPDEETAKRIHPTLASNDNPTVLSSSSTDFSDMSDILQSWSLSAWVKNINDLEVEFIGTTDKFTKPTMILSSYNAG